MTRCAIRSCAVVLALAVSASPLAAQALPTAASPEAVGLSSDRLGRLTRVLKDAVDARHVAGTVTMVVRDGKVAYLEAVGVRDIATGAAMSPDTIFRIASMTKAVVSVGIMMLVEEGRLAIADPVSRYIPAFAKTTVLGTLNGRVAVVPATRAITIRDLLTHTAGISYGMGALEPYYSRAGFTQWYFADRREPMTPWIDKLATLPFDAQPGERWVYGYNTDILGNVIERITGQTLAAFIEERIATPLKMVDTAFFLPAGKETRLAAVHVVGPDGTITRAEDGHAGQSAVPHSGQGAYVQGPRAAFSGGAGLLSTAQDYARFMQMMMNGGELDGVRLLSPTTVTLMTSNHVGTLYQNGALGWGLGFEVVEQTGRAPRYGGSGEFSWSGAYSTTYWADPAEKLVVVYLSQLLPAGVTTPTSRVRTLVNQAIIGPPEPVGTPVPATAPATARQGIDLSSATDKDAAAIARDYQVVRDVRYGPDNRQVMDLHLAKDVSGLGSSTFTIVFLHGGGFSFGNKSDNTRYITPFLRKGLNVVNMSYRVGQGVAIATEDLTLALNHLAATADTHRLRLDRVVVGGFSAGGQIASTVALARQRAAYPFPLAAGIGFAAILNFSGPVDGLEVVEKVFLDYPTEDFKAIGRNLYPSGGRFTRDEMLRLFTPITVLR